MYDIEAVISPYADSQPSHIILPSEVIDRMPPLVSEEGINPEFQKFYEELVLAIAEDKPHYQIHVDKLYELTNTDIDIDSFSALIESQWGAHWYEFRNDSKSINSRGIDIELNMNRFQEIHRNLIGGFNIITYHTIINRDEFTGYHIPKIVRAHTELLFTYKNNKFVLLPQFSPFVQV